MRIRRSALVLLVVPVLLSACSGHGSHNMAEPAATVATATGVTANDGDLVFLHGMIGHHAQAVEMSDLALAASAGASASVKDLATRIKAAQQPEIDEMTKWLVGWGQPVDLADHDGHDMASMDGMMSDEDMKRLATLVGPEFDREWLSMMIEHHRGAVKQSQDVLASGSDAGVRELANRIIAAQQPEIDEMQKLLGA